MWRLPQALPGAAAAGEEEDDPLDAFMAGISEEVKADKPSVKAKPKAGIELDDDDNVADFLEVHTCPLRPCMQAAHVHLSILLASILLATPSVILECYSCAL